MTEDFLLTKDWLRDTKSNKLYKLLKIADDSWIERRRKITTASVFSQLTYSCFERRGLKHTLNKSACKFSPQAFCKARYKLPVHTFLNINKALQVYQGPRTFAIDGSKVHVHPSFLSQGWLRHGKASTTRTNNRFVSRPAKRPLMMISSLFNVETKTCYDMQITTHFNERLSALKHFECCKPGDTLIFDTGYFSRNLVTEANKSKLKIICRLKCDALKKTKRFFHSSRTSSTLSFVDTTGQVHRCFLYKYYILDKKYVCLTNYATTCSLVQKLYEKRWAVETSFRRLKTDLNLETAHSMSIAGFVQEVEARVLFDTFSCLNARVFNKDDTTVHSENTLKSYFHMVDVSLQIFHAISVVHEQQLKYISLVKILSTVKSRPWDIGKPALAKTFKMSTRKKKQKKD